MRGKSRAGLLSSPLTSIWVACRPAALCCTNLIVAAMHKCAYFEDNLGTKTHPDHLFFLVFAPKNLMCTPFGDSLRPSDVVIPVKSCARQPRNTLIKWIKRSVTSLNEASAAKGCKCSSATEQSKIKEYFFVFGVFTLLAAVIRRVLISDWTSLPVAILIVAPTTDAIFSKYACAFPSATSCEIKSTNVVESSGNSSAPFFLQ